MDLTHKREEKVRLGDQDFRSGYVIVDVFWSGSASAPILHAARMRGDYLDIWPNLTGIQRARLRQALIRRLIKKGAFMVEISLDIAGDENTARQIIADHEGVIVERHEDLGAGCPNYRISIGSVARARQLIRELYGDFQTTDAELDELYLVNESM